MRAAAQAARPCAGSRGAGLERVVDVLVKVEGGEHDDPSAVGGRVQDPPGGLEPVEVGHADVEQHHVRMQSRRVLDRLKAIFRLGDELEVIVGVEDRPQRSARERVVVGYQHSQAHASVDSSGKWARTA